MSSVEQLLQLVDDEIPAALALREKLHANPEGGFAEVGTATAIADALPFEPAPVAETGLVARIGGPRGVLVRAELDGLPIDEETDSPFAAANGSCRPAGTMCTSPRWSRSRGWRTGCARTCPCRSPRSSSPARNGTARARWRCSTGLRWSAGSTRWWPRTCTR